ncbi:hypothetical protein DICVIV_11015 [Dictyocaulus viviparus]|uniref:Sema domain-containing protein n=1 Tax=Dictyocaulus viviparus TaxID=29172 RepID=A0A0D8XKV2_DICVI|nr:hypothetical protein DICVIV_11015 [Dictyocaulus viviparus]
MDAKVLAIAYDPQATFAGDGLAPHSPDVIAPFLFSDRHLYIANAPDYSSTEPLLMRKDPLKVGTSDMLRTGRGETQTDSAQFVKLIENKNLASVTAGVQHVYGAFRSQLAGLGSSAVCAYSRHAVSQQMANVFRNKKAACPKANDTYEHTYIRNNPLNPAKISTTPLFVHYGKDRLTEILVQENIFDLSGRQVTVFFLATDRGNIFKIVKNSFEKEARHVLTIHVVEAATRIISLSAHIERLPNRQTANVILVLTPSQLILLPSSTCHRQQSCTECLVMNDPECAWILHGAECVAISENI